MDNAGDHAAEQPLAPFAVLALVIAGANFLVFPLGASIGPRGAPVMFMVAAAVLAAQMCLVATWGVFGSALFLTRLARCAGLGLACYACLVLGAWMAMIGNTNLGNPLEIILPMLVLLLVLPIVFFCVQLPLWALRVWLGWEIAKEGSMASGSYARPVMIKDLVLATAAVSVALALTRLTVFAVPDEPNDFLMAMAVLSACAAGASLVTLPPLVFAVLGSHQLAAGVLGVAAWGALFASIWLLAITILSGSLPSPPMVTAFTVMGFTFIALFTSGLLLTRNRGYRLRWRAWRRPPL